MDGVVTCYANAQHLKVLNDAGYPTVYLPLTISGLRPRQQKTHTVLVSGSTVAATYPLRARLAHVLREVPGYSCLDHPGYELSQAKHSFVGEQYLRLCDQFELMVTDRAGDKDRLVSKYLEAAMCHALPVGDCPTYMPREMRSAMVDVTRLNHDVQIVQEVKRLIRHPDELKQRQDDYANSALFYYGTTDWGMRVMKELQS
jgi:hypothetical protein